MVSIGELKTFSSQVLLSVAKALRNWLGMPSGGLVGLVTFRAHYRFVKGVTEK